ncbi:MAG TPA: 7-carboxy-7-deazaguanine synthase QueE, partial [Thermoanaerobaculia bacterium]|nr:7-carboxy-7-deazaguanine synthase QueE [Thermoanaerobaculia bacterium]
HQRSGCEVLLHSERTDEQALIRNATCCWVILTGGEPALQVDSELIDILHAEGYRLAIETNGSVELPSGIDWITVSPKVAEHAIRQRRAHEVKYVRGYGQAIPKTVVEAEHYLISPAFDGAELDRRTLDWCIRLCRDNPPWRLSVQQHKQWSVR